MKSKKASHVGVILSFVIFVTFLIFLYSILEPSITTQNDKQFMIDYLKVQLKKDFSSNLTMITINTNKSVGKDCIKLDKFFEEVEVNYRIIVKDEFEQVMVSEVSNNGKDVIINKTEQNISFFKIYNSEMFELLESEGMTGCKKLKKSGKGYIVGLIREEEYIFESKILGLMEEYNNDYEKLKEDLNVPKSNEFGFSFTYENETIVKTNKETPSTEIYAEEIPIIYVGNHADIKAGFMSVKVW